MVSARYKAVTKEKFDGATYTPNVLADFVATQIHKSTIRKNDADVVQVLDPAVGDGELLVSLLSGFDAASLRGVQVFGFETDLIALDRAQERITRSFPDAAIKLVHGSFLEFIVSASSFSGMPEGFDLIIANPPYVRTQIIGAEQAQLLAQQFGLSGRVDLYHAFIVGMARVLNPGGTAGIIVSNRFMTTKSGSSVRESIDTYFNVKHVWDLGDTKLFGAAVLPAVLLAERRQKAELEPAGFTTIYSSVDQPKHHAKDALQALRHDGVVEISDGRRFLVKTGRLERSLPEGVWRIANSEGDAWLEQVKERSFGTFRDIGRIRVGIKTCADKIFVRNDWEEFQEEKPELLRDLTTHHVGHHFKAKSGTKKYQVLYPHEFKDGKRKTVDLELYPKSKAYLEKHRAQLEGREYVIEAGRQWYEIWVPQDPNIWSAPKLVFRDIVEKPTFWVDLEGTIVNGDCYWLACENSDTNLLWLAAAVANSQFIEEFYDRSFNNKLYSGRRRFITQYVEKFPLPDPNTPLSHEIIRISKRIYGESNVDARLTMEERINELVYKSFGLSVKKVDG